MSQDARDSVQLSTPVQAPRTRQTFSKRTFFLPKEQGDADQSDHVSITLTHTCENPDCPYPHLKNDQILKSVTAVEVEDPQTRIIKHQLVWLCISCKHVIAPTLKVRVGSNPNRPVEEVPFFHSVQLRNLLETFLQVDINYRSVEQRDLNSLRQNPHLFWNLIYYFSETKIPFEFLIPYRDSALVKLLAEMLEPVTGQSRQLCLENSRRHGLAYLDSYVALQKASQQRGITTD